MEVYKNMKKYNNYYKKQPIIKEQQQTEPQVFYITKSKLYLRSTPVKGNNVITIMPKDQKVIYLETANDYWYKVKYQNYIGYCMKEFLK